MKIYKQIVNFSLIIVFLISPLSFANSKTVPNSFADLAEKINAISCQYIKHTNN